MQSQWAPHTAGESAGTEKEVEQFLKKLNMYFAYAPANLPLGILPKEMKIYAHTETCTPVFLAALFIIAPNLETSWMFVTR